MHQRRRVTINDVAQAAGVSTQTVSRVLNDRPDVAADTVERIRRIIADTGYSPNLLARGLTQGRSHVLGVVAYGLEYFGPSRVLTGIDQEAAASGYSLSLSLIHEPETRDVARLLGSLSSRQVDGIIWTIPQVGDNRVWSHAMRPDFPVPVLLVGGMHGTSTLPSIGIDNRSIGRLATEHLLAGGARRVGIVTGPLDWWEAQQRRAGWRETLEANGLQASEQMVVVGDWTADSGERALGRLLEASPDLDAVFASNDQMALGVMHAAHRLGRRVPDDLAVVGVDDIAESSHFWPSLTTVSQPLRDAGALAVREIERAIVSATRSRGTETLPAPLALLEPTLIVRESSRAVAPAAQPGGADAPTA